MAALLGLISGLTPYRRTLNPKKSKPSSRVTTCVLSSLNERPLGASHAASRALICSACCLGETGVCVHQPGVSYGSPNGWFPMHDGNSVVTEINGDWIDVLSPDGRVLSSTNAPGFSYPSDTNEVRPGVLLSADYTDPGAIETFTPSGHLLWRYAPSGPQALNHPSLAEPLPNGDILANDDHNDRVIVIDPRTNRIVWQYGHTHIAGRQPGYLADPDGVDLAPPYSLLDRFK